jgi:hypothetical protein
VSNSVVNCTVLIAGLCTVLKVSYSKKSEPFKYTNIHLFYTNSRAYNASLSTFVLVHIMPAVPHLFPCIQHQEFHTLPIHTVPDISRLFPFIQCHTSHSCSQAYSARLSTVVPVCIMPGFPQLFPYV